MEGYAPFIVVGIVVLFLLWIAFLFNELVKARTACDESWSGIDTELKRRYDLIPNLVETVKGYAAHEKDVLERVTEARNVAKANRGSPESQAQDENVLVRQLRQLWMLAEGYPALKAGKNFLQLQEELAVTEDRIQRARRFYNGNVRDLNNRIETFPSSVVAGIFGFKKREFFEIEDSSMRQAPPVEL
jgi:LemA protein